MLDLGHCEVLSLLLHSFTLTPSPPSPRLITARLTLLAPKAFEPKRYPFLEEEFSWQTLVGLARSVVLMSQIK